MIIFLIIIFAVSGFLLGFGDAGRGTWSPYISIIAGLVWLGGLILAFVSKGIVFGVISIVGSFVVSGITMEIGKWALRKSSRLIR